MKLFEEWVFQVADQAAACGFYPARLTEQTDWERVFYWLQKVRRDSFQWEACDGWQHEPIIVGPGPDGTTAVHAGQCRLLAGLLADKPVPDAQLTWLSVEDPTRCWEEPLPDIPLETLLPMDRPDQAWATTVPAGLEPIGGR